MAKGRIIEAYCWRPIENIRNPLGGKKKMRVSGGCILAVADAKPGSKVKYFGAGTVKIIPISRKDVKEIAKTLKRR